MQVGITNERIASEIDAQMRDFIKDHKSNKYQAFEFVNETQSFRN